MFTDLLAPAVASCAHHVLREREGLFLFASMGDALAPFDLFRYSLDTKEGLGLKKEGSPKFRGRHVEQGTIIF